MKQRPRVSTTPLWQWGFRQCLPFNWATLSGKHLQHPIGVMGAVDILAEDASPWLQGGDKEAKRWAEGMQFMRGKEGVTEEEAEIIWHPVIRLSLI